jgi:mono/diheme cytochrome c family protein
MKRLTLAVSVLATFVALAAPAGKPDPKQLARGKYLVTIGGCNDCHTPLKKTPEGPAWDMDRMLSGHPGVLPMPAAPLNAEPWGLAFGNTMTAFSGPWGTSFSRNLTPDPETGLGAWTEKDFIATIRNGRHLGRGRPLLPPMPWFNYREATDDDLKAIFAYLRSIPAVKNRVPDPRPPTAPATTASVEPR